MARAPSNESAGIELSLLEGIDERLLERLHRLGVRNREDLGRKMETADSRISLADEIGVSRRRIEVLHHLNFLLPEERADKLLVLEQDLYNQSLEMNRGLQTQRTLLSLLTLGVVVAGVVLFFLRPTPQPTVDLDPLHLRVGELENRVLALAPLARAQVESRLQVALSDLGPAPGWRGPIRWSGDDHEQLLQAMGASSSGAGLPVRAVSVALRRLAELENSSGTDFAPVDRARRAADLAAEFPRVPHASGRWETAAVLIRQRFRTRALGLAATDSEPPDIRSAAPWAWTSPGFFMAEVMATGLHSLPLEDEAFETWTETVRRLREAAAVGGEDLTGRPEAVAQELWLRKAELDLAVAADLLGRSTMEPYDRRSPRNFLVQRRGFVSGARDLAGPGSRAPLAWLLVEYEEALLLSVWIESHPEARAEIRGAPWVEALRTIEDRRSDAEPRPELQAWIRDAVTASGGGTEDPWASDRTRWEAGLRPLLMVTRAVSTARPEPPASG